MVAFILFYLTGQLGLHTGNPFWATVSGVCLMISLVQLYNALHYKPSRKIIGPPKEPRDKQVSFDTTRYVCDKTGKLHDVKDGSFSLGPDGRYRGSVSGNRLIIIDRDQNGNLHII